METVPPEKPHFFKPIQPGFKNGLKIPVGFLKYLKGQEQEHAVLRRAGKEWPVKLNGWRFEEGWENFLEDHDLHLGDILVFRHERDMEFEVVILDSSHCNREYAEHIHEKEAHTLEKTSKKFEFKDKPNPRIVSTSKDFHHAEAATRNPSGKSHFECIVRPRLLSEDYLRIPTKFARANDLINKECGLIIRGERRRSWNLSLTTYGSQSVYMLGGWAQFRDANDLKVGDHIRFEVVTKGKKPIWKFRRTRDFRRKTPSTFDEDDHSYFISTITPYCINRPVLYLPMRFAKSNGLVTGNCEMILKDEAHRSWSVYLARWGRNLGITRGWKNFREANGLQVGDSYKFELIKNGKIPTAYFHFLGGSPSLQKNLDAKRIKNSGVTAPKSQVAASTSAEDPNPHFISTIKPYTIRNPVLYLPAAFARSNGLLNRTEMILVDEKQRSWSVRLGPTGGHFAIKRRGWAQFMKSNGIRAGDTYKFELVNNGKIPVAYFHLLGSSPSLKKKSVDTKRNPDKAPHLQEYTGLRIKNSGMTAAKSQVAASTSAADDANPHFFSTIKPYTITTPVLYLPMAFAKSNGLLNRTEMILVDEKQRSWSVRMGPMGGHFAIKSREWAQFMKSNGIRVGDTYKFELVNNGTIPIAYFHCKYSGNNDKDH